MTNLEIRAFLDSVDAETVRKEQDVSARRVARALGVTTAMVRNWEKRITTPSGPLGCRYTRILQGLVNHVEAAPGWREMAAMAREGWCGREAGAPRRQAAEAQNREAGH